MGGAVGGAVAFIAGYLITWIVAGTQVSQLFVSGPFGGGIPDWKASLWVFFDSHFVGTRTPQVTGPGGSPIVGEGLVDTVGLLGIEYLYLLPVITLLGMGAVVAWRADAISPREGMIAGMTIAIGYVVVGILAMMVGQQTGVGPSPLRALFIAGGVYPIALGGVGGAVFGFFSQD
ncbi:hypothetical protein ACKVMT_01945 [Halobacteriales archaeon Cl-PHB]